VKDEAFMNILVHYAIDASLILGLLLGTIGALYTAYDLLERPHGLLRRFTAAATLGLMGALISGVTIGLPALDAALSPKPGIISFLVGGLIWFVYGKILLRQARILNEQHFYGSSERPSSSHDQQVVEQNSTQTIQQDIEPNKTAAPEDENKVATLPADMAEFMLSTDPYEYALWSTASAGAFGWGASAFLIAPQGVGAILGYVVLTIIIGGILGAVYGFCSRSEESKPSHFSLNCLVVFTGIIALMLGVIMGVIFLFKGTFPIPNLLRIPLFLFILVVPVLTTASGFAPFVRWKMDALEKNQFGIIGIWLILLAFAIQLIQPITDILLTPRP
jgi:hypothetical protein